MSPRPVARCKALPEKVNITLNLGHGFAWQNANWSEDPTTRAAILARFWALVNRSEAKGCWPFTGYVASHGYGQFSYGDVRVRAHRFSWLMSRGPIPEGYNVCHHCDNPRCVNPNHLFLGLQRDNMHDAVRKGRKRAWGLQKLNADQVREIRALCAAGALQRDVAARFGIARNTVSGIVNRKSWAHLTASDRSHVALRVVGSADRSAVASSVSGRSSAPRAVHPEGRSDGRVSGRPVSSASRSCGESVTPPECER